MAEPETDSEVRPLTRAEKMMWWQLCRITIDYKNQRIKRDQALEEFSAVAELPTGLCWMLLGPMSKEKVSYLRKAFPDWITKDMEPKLDDIPPLRRN